MRKSRGTALLVTILLAGVIGAVAFGIFKIAGSELFIGTKGEEGMEAYYAAQAGVEDALMRFKFKDGGKLEIPRGATEDSPSILRVDPNDQNNDSQAVIGRRNYMTNNPVPNEDKYAYDLKVWYKEEGRFEIDLGKDESVILDVSEVARGSGSIRVRWEISRGDKGSTKLWYRLTDPRNNHADPRGIDRDFFTYLADHDDNDGIPGIPISLVPPLPEGRRVSLKVHGFQTIKFKVFSKDERTKVNLRVIPLDPNEKIGGPHTYIESTGYYGDTARKIKVKLDRATKSVLDIFDYVIYSPQDPLP